MDLKDNEILEYFAAENALERVNGDAVFASVENDHLFIGVIDGAGHGPEAHEIAQASCRFLDDNKNLALPDLMSALHESLRGTRGGVAIIGKLNYESLEFSYVGIGNVVLRKVGNTSQRAVMQDGVIGYQIRTPHEKSIQFVPGDVLIMHSDGITSQFDQDDYPGMLRDNAETIANNLIDKFGKNNDDATCIVIRFK